MAHHAEIEARVLAIQRRWDRKPPEQLTAISGNRFVGVLLNDMKIHGRLLPQSRMYVRATVIEEYDPGTLAYTDSLLTEAFEALDILLPRSLRHDRKSRSISSLPSDPSQDQTTPRLQSTPPLT